MEAKQAALSHTKVGRRPTKNGTRELALISQSKRPHPTTKGWPFARKTALVPVPYEKGALVARAHWYSHEQNSKNENLPKKQKSRKNT